MCTLLGRRAHIRARWEELLRAARVNTPLANPDMLVHLLDSTLDEILHLLRDPHLRHRTIRTASIHTGRANCECGRNPLLAYFLAGEQALLEALVLAQATPPVPDPVTRDSAVAELYQVVRGISQREVEAFCSVCQHRQQAPVHAGHHPMMH